MSATNKAKKTRKPGSGRKRKIGAVTSQDYSEQLDQLEKQEALGINLTPQQKDALRKRKRSLRNRMSALKSREGKRMRLENLEKTVQCLQQQIQELRRENQALRQSRFPVTSTDNICDNSRRAGSRWNSTAPPNENLSSEANMQSMQPSLDVCSEAQKISTPVKACAHSCGSAVSTPPRNSQPFWMTGQYSHTLWEMPCKTLRQIFSMLWMISKTLIASKTNKALLQATATYQHTQGALKQIFFKTLILSRRYDEACACNSAAEISKLRQRTFVIFDNISKKFLTRAMASARRI